MLVDLPRTGNTARLIAVAPPRPVRPMRRGIVLETLFDRIGYQDIAYCLLRGFDELHLEKDSYEIDLLVSPHDFERFRAVVTRAGFKPLRAWGSAPHAFFVKHDPGLAAWIKLDVVTDLRYGPKRAIRAGRSAADCLNRRRQNGSVYTLSPADEFEHLVFHGLLDKGALALRHRTRLLILRRELQVDAGASEALPAHFDLRFAPALTWAETTAACDRADWTWIEGRRRPLTRRLFRRQSLVATWRAVRGWTARRLRPLAVLRPRDGLVVALLGPDGAGKTTVASALARSAPLPVRRVYMGFGRREGEPGSWVRRGLWRLASATPADDDPPMRRRFRLGLRWCARAALQVSRAAVVRVRRAAGQVVLLDRHVYDLWLTDGHQHQYDSRARRVVRWCLTAVSPVPDLVLVLDAPAETLRKRKAEWPAEVLAGQRDAYRELGERLPQGVIVDAGRDFGRVLSDVATEIWQRWTRIRASSAPDRAPGTPALQKKEDVAKEQIRGSSLLLSGRVISLGVMALAQVLLIRYLSPADYGRWTYALAAVTVMKSFAGLGIDRAITRFVAIYYERGDRARLLGVMLLTIAAVLGAGGLMIGVLYAVPDQVMRLTQSQPEPLRLLFILVLLVPLEALDSLLLGVFACFGNARAIFFRRHIVAPGLRLAAVLVGVLSHASVVVLAYGYVIAGAVGILIYGRLLWRLCRDAGLFTQVRVTVPAREVFAFTFPMLVVDVAVAVMYGAGALALGYYSDMNAVAVFMAALPLATLNQSVMRCFSLLYTSSSSKLLARGDFEGINELYWQTAVWLAVLTFPIFAMTFSAADALTQLLYGTQYAAAGPILAVLALGEYVNVALGFNGLTLRVLNRAGYLTAISAGAAIVTVLLVAWAAPRYGAWGVAIATSASMMLHNLFKQAGLRLATGVRLFEPRYAGFYLALGASTAGLMLANWLLPGRPIAMLGLTAVASGSTLLLCKRVLKIADVFPEIRRVPIVGALLA